MRTITPLMVLIPDIFQCQVLPSDIGKYCSLFLITAAVVAFISMFFDHTVVVVVFVYILIL